MSKSFWRQCNPCARWHPLNSPCLNPQERVESISFPIYWTTLGTIFEPIQVPHIMFEIEDPEVFIIAEKETIRRAAKVDEMRQELYY